jgi:hypothetical protein
VSGARSPATTAFLSMADSVASPQSRPQRTAKKRRQATVSSETENKLARAARSAQRLAQLSDASRDDCTLDLFPDDPTRATLEAMKIDIRQGTLHGFELPDVVLAAVGAIDAADAGLPDAKAVRRAPRVARADEPAQVNAQLSGLEIIEPSMPVPVASVVTESALADVMPVAERAVEQEPVAAAVVPLTPAMAAATVARSVTALRQAAEPGVSATDPVAASVSSASSGGNAPQRFAATFVKAASASRETVVARDVSTAGDVHFFRVAITSGAHIATAGSGDAKQGEQPLAKASASAASADAASALAATRRDARRAEAAAAALRAAPELDRARATAFADTVDALYGVIADQRHAATDHSRRMKWMLSIVVGALLVTVAIGITQTLLLMRLTRETSAQQHRIEQMMQNQQAAMASLLDTHIAMANAAAANAASAPTTPAVAPQAAKPAHGHRAARAPYRHRAKVVASN